MYYPLLSILILIILAGTADKSGQTKKPYNDPLRIYPSK